MGRFDNFTEEERDIIVKGLINECESFLDYGINGYSNEGKREYNQTLSLLLEADSKKKYEYIYKNWKQAKVK